MCDWQKEQDRLLKLWEESEADEFVEGEDSEVDDELDHLSNNSEHSDLEQEAANEQNENVPVEECEGREEEGDNENVFVGKNGARWSKVTPNKNVRTRAENIITHLPGVKTYGKGAKTAIQCFYLFIDQEMIADIVKHTNDRISEKSEKWKNSPHYVETMIVEIKSLIGLLYLAGVFKNNHRNLHELWNTDGTGMDIFRYTMSHRRFEFLPSCLRFDKLSRNTKNRQISSYKSHCRQVH